MKSTGRICMRLFYRTVDTAQMVFLCRRVLAVDAFYRNPVFRISRTINPLGTEQATAAQAELSCGCGNPGTVLADLNRSNHCHRSDYLDHVICTHGQGRFYWAGFVLGFLSYRAQYLTIILPLLFLRRMWSEIFGFSTAFLSLIVLGGLMFSFDSYWQYIEAVGQQSGRIENLTQPLSHYVTVYGFFRQPLPQVWALCGAALASSILIYWLWKVWRGGVHFQSGILDLQYASLVTTTLLLMYHGFVYDLLLLHPQRASLSIQIVVVSLSHTRAAISLFRSLHAAGLSRAIFDKSNSTGAYVLML